MNLHPIIFLLWWALALVVIVAAYLLRDFWQSWDDWAKYEDDREWED